MNSWEYSKRTGTVLSMDLPTVEEVLGKLEEGDMGAPLPSLRSRAAAPAVFQQSCQIQQEYEKGPIKEKEGVLTN